MKCSALAVSHFEVAKFHCLFNYIAPSSIAILVLEDCREMAENASILAAILALPISINENGCQYRIFSLAAAKHFSREGKKLHSTMLCTLQQ
jgi:hypothetical protein